MELGRRRTDVADSARVPSLGVRTSAFSAGSRKGRAGGRRKAHSSPTAPFSSAARQLRMTVAGCGVGSVTDTIATKRCPSGVTAYARPNPKGPPPKPAIVKSDRGVPAASPGRAITVSDGASRRARRAATFVANPFAAGFEISATARLRVGDRHGSPPRRGRATSAVPRDTRPRHRKRP